MSDWLKEMRESSGNRLALPRPVVAGTGLKEPAKLLKNQEAFESHVPTSKQSIAKR